MKSAPQHGVVALTDERWFEFLRARSEGERLDEVNFWRPQAQQGFRSLSPGEPFFFRLKHPVNAVAGYGFFAHATRLPIRMAWETFGENNGDASFERFVARIAEYRHETPLETVLGTKELTCLVLREARFLQTERYVPWNQKQEWSRNIVAFKRYDLGAGAGLELAACLRNGVPEEFSAPFVPLQHVEKAYAQATVAAREGQGAFRVRLLDAYGRRCAVTGERSLPVLDAAHIQPYLSPVSNHLQNGLVLRADIHRLFDQGYVTVTPAYRFAVSDRLRQDYDNGRVYYELDGRPLAVLPKKKDARPNEAALDWHAREVFRR